MPQLRFLPRAGARLVAGGTQKAGVPEVIVHADGGSRGNPGVAGCGSIVDDAATGTTLRSIAWVVGAAATNNVAEYQGLINGLRAAAELGARRVSVRMDSKLVVEQMSGRWKIKHPEMQKLAAVARGVAEEFAEVTYTWVPRKKNAAADELANVAMDAAAKGHPVGEVATGAGKHSGVAGVARAGGRDDAPAKRPAGLSGATVEDTTAQHGKTEREENSPRRWSAATGPTTTLILLRHGETPLSAQGRYSGHGDPELSPRGCEQARAVAEVIRARGGIDRIVSSPLRRARQTAEYVSAAIDLDAEIDGGFVEADFGEWEGLSFAEARARAPELHARWLNDPTAAPPHGESFDDVFARVATARRNLVARHKGETIVVVSHVNPIKAVIADAIGADAQAFQRIFLELASLSVVEVTGEESLLRGLNITGGLAAD